MPMMTMTEILTVHTAHSTELPTSMVDMPAFILAMNAGLTTCCVVMSRIMYVMEASPRITFVTVNARVQLPILSLNNSWIMVTPTNTKKIGNHTFQRFGCRNGTVS